MSSVSFLYGLSLATVYDPSLCLTHLAVIAVLSAAMCCSGCPIKRAICGTESSGSRSIMRTKRKTARFAI